ncbi:MAG: hypothetical protein NXH78_01670 [Hyphomonadaceae bacterium]|nr:hypothetical protein [Hyphomonadaceae bacterium]
MLRALLSFAVLCWCGAAPVCVAQSAYEYDRYIKKLNDWSEMTGFIFRDASRIVRPSDDVFDAYVQFMEGKISEEAVRSRIEFARESVESETRFARESVDFLPEPPAKPDWSQMQVFFTPDKLNRILDHSHSHAVEVIDFVDNALGNEYVDFEAFARIQDQRTRALLTIDETFIQATLSQLPDRDIPVATLYELELITLEIAHLLMDMQTNVLANGNVTEYVRAQTKFESAIESIPETVQKGERQQVEVERDIEAECRDASFQDQTMCDRARKATALFGQAWALETAIYVCLSENSPARIPQTEADRVRLGQLMGVLELAAEKRVRLSDNRVNASEGRSAAAKIEFPLNGEKDVDLCTPVASEKARSDRKKAAETSLETQERELAVPT